MEPLRLPEGPDVDKLPREPALALEWGMANEEPDPSDPEENPEADMPDPDWSRAYA